MWPFIAAAAAVVGVGTGVAFAYYNWDAIVSTWTGKKIVLLGARQTGKSTFAHFLLNGELPSEYKGTVVAKISSGTRRRVGELKLDISKLTDVPGEHSAREFWRKSVNEISSKDGVLCYFLRGDLYFSGNQEHIDRVEHDIRHIADWMASKNEDRPILFLIATHCDLIRGYAKASEKKKQELADMIWNREDMREITLIAGGDKFVRRVAGSLVNLDGCEALGISFFNQNLKP